MSGRQIVHWQIVWVVVGAILLGGCTYRRVVRDGWGPLRELADKPTVATADAPDRRNSRDTSPSQWAILLEVFSGVHRHAQAIALIRALKDAGVDDVWVQEAGELVYLYRGRYTDPNGARPQDVLRQTRQMTVGGEKRLVAAELTPMTVSPQDMPSEDPLDLRRFRGMYTLQVGFYDDAFGSRFRLAAEQAARDLRERGEEAYYYHGPNRSLVTVGLFSDDDLMPEGVRRVYGPVIRDLQARFPNNLGNGAVIEKRTDGQVTGNHRSFLVRVF